MIDELSKKYDELRGVVEVLPTNTKYGRKRKNDLLLDELNKDKARLDTIRNEIEKRLEKFNNLKSNNEIETLTKELEKCNVDSEWNTFNTSYEKMHLDYYLYQLHRYYKEDLKSVNDCINRIIESFKNVDITLTKKDFDFNNYTMDYMDRVLNNATQEELNNLFEKYYWKNSDFLKILEINFKSIYFKYEKKINKHYEIRHQEFLKEHNDQELEDLRIKLNDRINALNNCDFTLNFNRFVNGSYSIADYNDIDKIKDKYFKDNSYNFADVVELMAVLKEYSVLINYKYLFDDIKNRINNIATFKNSKNNALKKLMQDESKLRKFNIKQNRKSIFGKKNNEKNVLLYNELVNNVTEDYNELLNSIIDDIVYNNLNKDSTILDALKLVCSNYLFFVNKTYEVDETQSINDIDSKFDELKKYVNNNKFYILNNVALLDEKQMKQLIVEKYNLNNIALTLDNLISLDSTISDISKLINYENIVKSGINIDDISLYLEYKKIDTLNEK